MSQLRTGHKPSDWRDEGPSHAHLSSIRGSLAVGESSRDVMKRQSREYKAREAEKARRVVER